MKEDIEDIEKSIGSISGWQKIIMMSLLIIIAMWELDITV
jgi:hypothetical protein|tara:strand:+ start:741 stop:860 length:120 start_codon:yes stop_codon:yes gene_type:complete